MATTKIVNGEKYLEGNGEMDYDYVNDILFFKIEDREYDRSIELNNLVVDIDSEDLLTGLQIFDASKYLGITKSNLKINGWHFKARITPEAIEVRLLCQINIRNKIRELSPIITQQNIDGLPGSSAMAIAA